MHTLTVYTPPHTLPYAALLRNKIQMMAPAGIKGSWLLCWGVGGRKRKGERVKEGGSEPKRKSVSKKYAVAVFALGVCWASDTVGLLFSSPLSCCTLRPSLFEAQSLSQLSSTALAPGCRGTLTLGSNSMWPSQVKLWQLFALLAQPCSLPPAASLSPFTPLFPSLNWAMEAGIRSCDPHALVCPQTVLEREGIQGELHNA